MPEAFSDDCTCQMCVEAQSRQAPSSLENLSIAEKPLPPVSAGVPQQPKRKDDLEPGILASKAASATVRTELAQPTGPAIEAPKYVFGPKDIIIAVMGLTGSGKTTFIQELTDEVLKIGVSLESCTIKTSPHKCNITGYGPVWLVDTPGFDDSYRTDPQILAEVASFLTAASDQKIFLTGIIYLHRIQDPRTGQAAMRNIRTFKKLCGKDGLSRTTLVTTFWKHVNEEDGMRREDELLSKNDLWSFIRECGGKAFRFKESRESAKEIVEHIIKSKLGPTKLDLQRELDEGKQLSETGAGEEVYNSMEQLKAYYEETIEKLKAELDEAIKEKDDEIKALKAETQAIEEKEKEIHAIEKELKEERKKLRIANEDRKLLELKKDGLRKRVRATFCPVM